MSKDRTTRAAESRAATDLRSNYDDDDDGQGMLHIDLNKVPSDIELRWVRESVLGERDRGNLQLAMMKEGFQPAMADDFPDLRGPRLPGDTEDDQYIRAGGLILMQRPRVVGDRAKQKLALENKRQVAAVRRDLNAGMDGQNFQHAPDSMVTVTETTSDGRQRVSRTTFAE